MRCLRGRSALYYAMRYEAPAGVAELLLHADPKAALDEDRDGVCPLGLVWDGYANGFGGKRDLKALLRKFEGEFEYSCGVGGSGSSIGGGEHPAELNVSNSTNANNNERHENGMVMLREEELTLATKRVREAMRKDTPALRQLQTKWRIVNNLLRAYFRFPIQTLDSEYIEDEEEENEKSAMTHSKIAEDNNDKNRNNNNKRKWRILHAVSAIKCHHTLFLLARALHPEQALELDCNDLLRVDCYRHCINDGSDEGSNRHRCDSGDYHEDEPQSISVESRPVSKRTALHFAAASPSSGKDGRNVIRTLLALNPDSSRHADGHGSLPLHLMAENEHKVHWVQDGFRDLHNAYPEASSRRDGEGRTPLHCATSCSGRYSSVTSSPPAAPAEENAAAIATATTTHNNNNAAPPDLNNAARNIGSVILNLIIVHRNAASVADNTGRLPLHYIAEHGEEWSNDAASILAAHPAASRTRAAAVAYHRLPLHMAASNPDACPSLLRNLVEAHPRAASVVDGTGRLPLHMACDSGRTSWDRGIESIYEAYRAAVSAREESPRGWTVLHTVAASPSAGRDLIEHVLNLNPGAASVADGEGRHPLHLACMAGRHWEEGGVRLLFEADPNATLTGDRFGFLPFHMVAMKKACLVDNSSANAIDRSDDDIERKAEGDERLESNEEEDLASMDVLFNLLIAQPDTIQSK